MNSFIRYRIDGRYKTDRTRENRDSPPNCNFVASSSGNCHQCSPSQYSDIKKYNSPPASLTWKDLLVILLGP